MLALNNLDNNYIPIAIVQFLNIKKFKDTFRTPLYWPLNFYNFCIQYSNQIIPLGSIPLKFFTSNGNFNLLQSDFEAIVEIDLVIAHMTLTITGQAFLEKKI